MSRKTISIDSDAYDLLKRCRKGNESFSQTIKRFIKSPNELLRVVDHLGKNPLSDQAIEAIEQVVAARRATSSTRRARRRAG